MVRQTSETIPASRSMSNPYESPQFAEPTAVPGGAGDRARLRRVARYQKWVLYALLANIIYNIVAYATQGQGLLVSLAVLVGAIAVIAFAMTAVFLLANELYSPAIGIVCAIVMIIPCISLITLLVINGKATEYLQQNGIKVGFMGVNPNTI
jgi:hypothetical protein